MWWNKEVVSGQKSQYVARSRRVVSSIYSLIRLDLSPWVAWTGLFARALNVSRHSLISCGSTAAIRSFLSCSCILYEYACFPECHLGHLPLFPIVVGSTRDYESCSFAQISWIISRRHGSGVREPTLAKPCIHRLFGENPILGADLPHV